MVQLLIFTADWCGPCQVMKPLLEELEGEYNGKIEFKQVDVDEEGAIAQKYDIVSVPTLVLAQDGKEKDRKKGAAPKESIKQWIDSVL